MNQPPEVFSDLIKMEEDINLLLHSNTDLGQNLRREKEVLDRLGVESEVRLRHGLVISEVFKEIRRGDYDLVVTGSSPTGSTLRTYIMGNITREIVNRAECPVLVVRSEDEPVGIGRSLKGFFTIQRLRLVERREQVMKESGKTKKGRAVATARLLVSYSEIELSLDIVSDVLDGLAGLAADFAEAFLDVPLDAVHLSFGFHVAIIDRAAYVLFHRALGLIPFAFHFILVKTHAHSLLWFYCPRRARRRRLSSADFINQATCQHAMQRIKA